MGSNMGLEYTSMRMETIMKENGKMTKNVDVGCTILLPEKRNTLDSFKMDVEMV